MSFLRASSLNQNLVSDSKFIQTRISNLESEYIRAISAAHAQILSISDQSCRDNLLDCFDDNNYIALEQINNLRKEVAWYLRKTSCWEKASNVCALTLMSIMLLILIKAPAAGAGMFGGVSGWHDCCYIQPDLINQLKQTKITIERAFTLSEKINFFKIELDEINAKNQVALLHLKKD